MPSPYFTRTTLVSEDRSKRRPHIPGIYGIDSPDDFDFDGEADEIAVRRASREIRKWLNRQGKRVRRIASEDRYWLRRYAALEKFEQQTREEENATDRLLNSYRTTMHLELERQWLAAQLERVKKAQVEINRSIVKAEREEFARRGILRGRRK